MRSILIAMLIAGGLGLVGTSNASAAPVTGSAAREAATLLDPVEKVQHWRWGSGGGGGHWRWGSRPRPRLCHRPYTSRVFRCW